MKSSLFLLDMILSLRATSLLVVVILVTAKLLFFTSLLSKVTLSKL